MWTPLMRHISREFADAVSHAPVATTFVAKDMKVVQKSRKKRMVEPASTVISSQGGELDTPLPSVSPIPAEQVATLVKRTVDDDLAIVETKTLPVEVVATKEITRLARKHKVEEAQAAFDEAVQRGVVPNEFMYTSLLSAYARTGKVSEAVRVMNDMQAKGLAVGLAAYNLVVRSSAATQRVTQALQMVRRMKQHGVRPDIVTFRNIIPHCTTRFQIRHAVDILRGLYDANYLPSTKDLDVLTRAYKTAQTNFVNLVVEKSNLNISNGVVTSSPVLSRAGDTKGHPTLLQSLKFEPSAELLERLKFATKKRGKFIVEKELKMWAVAAFEEAFRPKETVRSFGWRLLKPTESAIAPPMRKQWTPLRAGSRSRDRKELGKPLRLLLKEAATRGAKRTKKGGNPAASTLLDV